MKPLSMLNLSLYQVTSNSVHLHSLQLQLRDTIVERQTLERSLRTVKMSNSSASSQIGQLNTTIRSLMDKLQVLSSSCSGVPAHIDSLLPALIAQSVQHVPSESVQFTSAIMKLFHEFKIPFNPLPEADLYLKGHKPS